MNMENNTIKRDQMEKEDKIWIWIDSRNYFFVDQAKSLADMYSNSFKIW